MLVEFDVFYVNYERLVSRNVIPSRGTPQPPMLRLLETYALGMQALQEREIIATPFWSRQEGATTTALSMLATSKGVAVMVSDVRNIKIATNRILQAFPDERAHVTYSMPLMHPRIFSMHDAHRKRPVQEPPQLIVVDSETAYRTDRDSAVAHLHQVYQCGILVLDAESSYTFF